MAPIQPYDSQLSSVNPFQSTQSADRLGQPSANPAAGASDTSAFAAQSIGVQSSSLQVTQVHQEVNSFLGTLGGNLQDNELLRMMIALLILNALLEQGGSSSSSGRGGSQALDLLGRMASSESVMMYQSSYSAMQIDYQSTSVMGSQSVQPSSSAPPQGDTPRLDLSA